MFKLVPDPTFEAVVSLTVPGTAGHADITVEFRYLTPDQLKAWVEKSAKAPTHEALSEVVVRWDGPVDAAGNPVAYSKAALRDLCTNHYRAGEELFLAYISELRGARRKNS